MSNSSELLRALSNRCDGKHGSCGRPEGGTHVKCRGRIAKDAARYPGGLCRAVLDGLRKQLRADGKLYDGCHGVQAPDEEILLKAALYGPEQGYSGKYKDSVTGQVLRDDLVVAARQSELKYFHDKSVWLKVPRGRAKQMTGKPPISVRWVDVNKGDEVEPNYRSRLVARQIKAMDRSGDSYFAPAPHWKL